MTSKDLCKIEGYNGRLVVIDEHTGQPYLVLPDVEYETGLFWGSPRLGFVGTQGSGFCKNQYGEWYGGYLVKSGAHLHYVNIGQFMYDCPKKVIKLEPEPMGYVPYCSHTNGPCHIDSCPVFEKIEFEDL